MSHRNSLTDIRRLALLKRPLTRTGINASRDKSVEDYWVPPPKKVKQCSTNVQEYEITYRPYGSQSVV